MERRRLSSPPISGQYNRYLARTSKNSDPAATESQFLQRSSIASSNHGRASSASSLELPLLRIHRSQRADQAPLRARSDGVGALDQHANAVARLARVRMAPVVQGELDRLVLHRRCRPQDDHRSPVDHGADDVERFGRAADRDVRAFQQTDRGIERSRGQIADIGRQSTHGCPIWSCQRSRCHPAIVATRRSAPISRSVLSSRAARIVKP